jgi:hypothetical protein
MLFSRLSLAACAATLLMSVAPARRRNPADFRRAGARDSCGCPMARMELARPTDTDPLQAKLDGKAFGVAPGLRIFSTETLLMNPVTWPARSSGALQARPVRPAADRLGHDRRGSEGLEGRALTHFRINLLCPDAPR